MIYSEVILNTDNYWTSLKSSCFITVEILVVRNSFFNFRILLKFNKFIKKKIDGIDRKQRNWE